MDNFQNTLYTGDNLYILHSMNSESVDLIYLDPPFNSKRTYSAPIGTKAAGASFKDMWSWADVDEYYLEKLAENHAGLVHFIESIDQTHSKAMMAYITYMAERVIECHRILKSTGSFYFHCDPTASHYVKVMLDFVFGKGNFRNEIIWERSPMKGAKATAGQFGRNIDIILFYSKNSEDYYFEQVYKAHDLDNKHNKFKYTDENGRIYSRDTPLGDYSDESIKEFEKRGRIYVTKNGKKQLIRYLDEVKGLTLGSTWYDIKPINQVSIERTGYPTQKPLKLLNRIISASCPADGIVLDPFCGCATTCVAAEHLGRKWIGIDIEEQAVSVVMERLADAEGQLFNKFINLNKPPKRTDIIEEMITPETKTDIKNRLFSQQNGHCNGCNGIFEIWKMEIDHIIPKAKGGGDYFENYQLLCGNCNRIKGARPMDYLRMKIEERKKMLKNKIQFGE